MGSTFELQKEILYPYPPEDQPRDGIEGEEGNNVSIEETIRTMLSQAEQEAKAIHEEAKSNAKLMIQQAQDQANLLQQNAFNQGYEEGYSHGYSKGKEEADQIILEANQTLELAIQERQQLFERLEPEVAELSLEIAKKILSNTVTVSPSYILQLLRKGIEKSMGEEDLAIRVSEEDYNFVIQNKEELYKMALGVDKIEVKKDLSLKKTQCIIETAFGNIDCSLDTQFNSIKDEFIKIMRNE